MDCQFSIGQTNTQHVVLIMFRAIEAKCEMNKLLKDLRRDGQISVNLGVMHLPEGTERQDGQSSLVLDVPLDEDVEHLASLLQEHFKARTDLELVRLSRLNSDLAQGYINTARG